jgi:hypothetical protein
MTIATVPTCKELLLTSWGAALFTLKSHLKDGVLERAIVTKVAKSRNIDWAGNHNIVLRYMQQMMLEQNIENVDKNLM